MKLTVTTTDLNRVDKLIAGLKDVEKDKVIKEGLRNAMALFLRAGRKNLQARMKDKNHTGNLMKSFRFKLKRMKLGSLAGFDGFGPHAHLVDLGTDERFTKNRARGKRKSHYTGSAKGNNFWTDAIETNENRAMEIVMQGIDR